MNAGICGGLDPDIDVGTLINPEIVVDNASGTEFHHHPPIDDTLAGKLMTMEAATLDVERSRRFLADGFLAVDMESAAVAEVCEARVSVVDLPAHRRPLLRRPARRSAGAAPSVTVPYESALGPENARREQPTRRRRGQDASCSLVVQRAGGGRPGALVVPSAAGSEVGHGASCDRAVVRSRRGDDARVQFRDRGAGASRLRRRTSSPRRTT